MPSADRSFLDYVNDAGHMRLYAEYQRRYAGSMRESDRVLIDRIRELVGGALARGEQPSVLDLGCSTGNLLWHLKQALPGLRLAGGDVAAGLERAGFAPPTFTPFRIPVDLAEPGDPADITSYTVRTGAGERLSFRGTLFQPWCHLSAQR